MDANGGIVGGFLDIGGADTSASKTDAAAK